MARRDYAVRNNSKKKKSNKTNKSLLIAVALVVLGAFLGALYLLKTKAPEPAANVPEVIEKKQPKSVLPNRPEEVWTYIKALETRTVPVTNQGSSIDKNMQLTAEQKKILQAMEKEQKQADERRKAELSGSTAVPVADIAPETTASTQTNSKPAEDKSVKPVLTPTPKAQDTAKNEPKVEVKKAEEKKKAEAVTTEIAVKSTDKKYGLQCGTFKSRENAENLQARLVMAGLNARVNTSGEWNRVQVGPIGNRDAAVKAQEKAKSIIGCVVIGM